MLLSTIFEQLTYGELANLPVSGELNTPGIQVQNYPAIISHINMGLTELYKTFPLKRDEVTVQQYDHIETYYLRKKYAQTNDDSDETYKYIEDTQFEPFLGNVLVIDEVVNEDGQVLFKNDDTEYWSVFTPTFDAVQVPFADSSNMMIVTYRADHAHIPLDTTEITTYEVELPTTHLQALLYFVAHRASNASPGLEDTNSANDYYAKYMQQVQLITDLQLNNETSTTNLKLVDQGYP